MIPQWHINNTVMRERAHGRQAGALLSSSLRSSGDEETGVFAPETASCPLFSSLVPEGFPLGGEVAVAGGDAEEEGVVFFELVGGDEGDACVLAWGVHFAEDF